MRADTRDELDERLTHKTRGASEAVEQELAQIKPKKQPKAKAAKTTKTFRIRATITSIPNTDVERVKAAIESYLAEHPALTSAKVTRVKEVLS